MSLQIEWGVPGVLTAGKTGGDGFLADKQSLDPAMRPYVTVQDNLSIIDAVVMLGQRIVVPEALRPDILKSLHAAHQSIPLMKERALDAVYCPNMTVDIVVVDHYSN